MSAPQPSDISPEKYRAMRERLDARPAVGRALGVSDSTMRLRESGRRAIDIEAELAMRYLTQHGLPRYIRDRPDRRVVDPANVAYGTPGELREALAILGMTPSQGGRYFFGDTESDRVRMSRMCTGAQSVTEDAARMVKRKLGLTLADPWPKREGIRWDNSANVLASLEGGR